MTIIPQKRCSHCKEHKPSTREFFSANKSTKDGLQNMCKTCYNQSAGERAKHAQIPPEGTMKFCSQCKQSKPATLDFFYSHRRESDHLCHICKECMQTKRRKPPKYVAPEGYKHCHQCHTDKPATIEYFPSRKTSKDGLYAWCKGCVSRKHKEQKPRIDPQMDSRTCSKCGKTYPFTSEYFHRSPYGINGLVAKCKFCVSEESRVYRDKNHDRVLNSTQRWRINNRTRVNSYSRQYYALHREHYSERWKQYYKAHRSEIRIRSRRHYLSHRDQMIAGMRVRREIHHDYSHSKEYSKAYYRKHRDNYIAKAHKRQARIKSLPGNYTAKDIQDQYKRQKGRCYYCRSRVNMNEFHVDHTFPISRDFAHNSIDHLVVACPRCNLRKGNKYPWEWAEGGRLL